jgi:hypothetical protein
VLLTALILIISIGLIHSYLGEKYILMRLFRQPLPKLFGDDSFTKQTLRFVWHLLTVAWFGLAAVLVLAHTDNASNSNLLNAIAITFAVTAITALVASRGRHLSWIVFSAISILCYVAAAAS